MPVARARGGGRAGAVARDAPRIVLRSTPAGPSTRGIPGSAVDAEYTPEVGRPRPGAATGPTARPRRHVNRIIMVIDDINAPEMFASTSRFLRSIFSGSRGRAGVAESDRETRTTKCLGCARARGWPIGGGVARLVGSLTFGVHLYPDSGGPPSKVRSKVRCALEPRLLSLSLSLCVSSIVSSLALAVVVVVFHRN